MPQHDEPDVQAACRVRAAQLGGRLFRNNSGAWQHPSGRWIRYGLGNDSAKVNDVLKSPDLIGWTPWGTAWLIECKWSGWTGKRLTVEETAQANFLRLGAQHGALAAFVTDPNQLDEMITRCREHLITRLFQSMPPTSEELSLLKTVLSEHRSASVRP